MTSLLSIELVGLVLSAVVGVVALIYGLKQSIHKTRAITIKHGDTSLNLSADKKTEQILREILSSKVINGIDNQIISGDKREASFSVFSFLVIPALLAVIFSAVYLYLLIVNMDNLDYRVPDELGSIITIIVGYYFGIGASRSFGDENTIANIK